MQYLVLNSLFLLQFAIIMSLHGPNGACISVASVSPIRVFPIQCVHKHSQYICDPKQS